MTKFVFAIAAVCPLFFAYPCRADDPSLEDECPYQMLDVTIENVKGLFEALFGADDAVVRAMAGRRVTGKWPAIFRTVEGGLQKVEPDLRNREIFRLRWGFTGEPALTLQETGDRVNPKVTRERIRVLTNRTFTRLKARATRAWLRAEIENIVRDRLPPANERTASPDDLIRDFGFSGYAGKVLEKLRVVRVAEISFYTAEQINAIPGCGPKVLDEIRRLAATVDVHLRGEFEPPPPENISEAAVQAGRKMARELTEFTGRIDLTWRKRIESYYSAHYGAFGDSQIRPPEVRAILEFLKRRAPERFLASQIMGDVTLRFFPIRLRRLKALVSIYDYLLGTEATNYLLSFQLAAASFPDYEIIRNAVDWKKYGRRNPFEQGRIYSVGMPIVRAFEKVSETLSARDVAADVWPNVDSFFRDKFEIAGRLFSRY